MAKISMANLGQVPPQAIDIEEAVLGAILIEQPALLQVIDLLQPEYFYKPAHQEVYRAIIFIRLPLMLRVTCLKLSTQWLIVSSN